MAWRRLGHRGLKEEWAIEEMSLLPVPGFSPSDRSSSQATGLHSETKQLPLPFLFSEWFE